MKTIDSETLKADRLQNSATSPIGNESIATDCLLETENNGNACDTNTYNCLDNRRQTQWHPYALKSVQDGFKECYISLINKKSDAQKEQRCQSMPNSLDSKSDTVSNLEYNSNDTLLHCCDANKNSPLVQKQQSTESEDLKFKTWPDKHFNDSKLNIQHEVKTANEMNGLSSNTKLTFNDALKGVSLAYSPITKQLHIVSNEGDVLGKKCGSSIDDGDTNASHSRGHKRNEPGSFSSTISSLSDPSSSGSLLESDDHGRQQLSLTDNEEAGKNRGRRGSTAAIMSFFNKGFGWKSSSSSSGDSASGMWRFFAKTTGEKNGQNSPQHEHVVASSSALIQHNRPSNLPAKTLEEEQRHRQEYEAILAAAKRKEAEMTAVKLKQLKMQLKLEEQQANATRHFLQNVLPKWETTYNSRKTKDLWWQGLPSSVRGKVWRLAIGNELNLTRQLYEICATRARKRLKESYASTSRTEDVDDATVNEETGTDDDRECSMDVIRLDITRTFPHLGIFQNGGPYSDALHALLAAYVCYRPDVGYVQGMSYIAAILILNMDDEYDAFVCFANLLNRPLHVAAFALDQARMDAYYEAYGRVFAKNMPRLHAHFEHSHLTPDLYFLDWIYTIYAKAMPLDVACRVWDLFLRDGDEFIFRTALGILHLNQEILLKMDFLQGAQFLTHLPEDLSSEQLFKSIQSVSTKIGKVSFASIVEMCKSSNGDEEESQQQPTAIE